MTDEQQANRQRLIRLRGGPGPRRVLFFGKSMSRTRCTGALVEALRLHGLETKWINLATVRRWFRRLGLGRRRARSWVRSVFRRFQPDLVFVFCRDLPLGLLDEFRATARVVLWTEEALEDLDETQIDYMRRADLVCLSNPAHIDPLRARGVHQTAFLMSGFSPTFHRPVAQKTVRDVAFIGGPGRRGQRVPFFAGIAEHFDTEVFGSGWAPYRARFPKLRVHRPVNAHSYAAVCAQSRIVVGINEVNQDPLYFSNRTWLTLACRGFHLTHYVPGLEQVFANGEHLVWFRDQAEAVRQIRRYLERNDERARIAAAGHRLAVDRHQYYHRIDEVLRRLDVIGPLRWGQPARPEKPVAAGGLLSIAPASD